MSAETSLKTIVASPSLIFVCVAGVALCFFMVQGITALRYNNTVKYFGERGGIKFSCPSAKLRKILQQTVTCKISSLMLLILFLLHRYNTLYWILNFGDVLLQPNNTNVSNSQCSSGTLIMFPHYEYGTHSNKIEHIPAHLQKMQVH